METNVFLLLGTNEGDRIANLTSALSYIEKEAVTVLQISKIYETAAWGNTDQPSFLNQVVLLETALDPEELLSVLLKIEMELGRIRKQKWGPRVIDIDILFYGDTVISTENLKIPHPEIQNRRFTLVPLVDLSPDFIHPTLHCSLRQLLGITTDELLLVSEYLS